MQGRLLRTTVLVLLLCVLGGVAGYVYYLLATPKYRAQIVVGPPNDMERDGSQNIRLNIPLLANIGGADSAGQHTQFLFQLTSFDTAANVARDRQIVQQLVKRGDLTDVTPGTVQAHIGRSLQVTKPRLGFLEESPFTVISVKDPDPAMARRLLQSLVYTSDKIIRARRLFELANQREEILRTLPTVTTAEYREALVRLLAQTERERIFARVSQHYTFRVVDPAVVSDKPAEPRLLLSVAIGIFAGFALALAILVLLLVRVTVVGSKKDA